MDQFQQQKPSLPSISSLIEAVKDQPQDGVDRPPNNDHHRILSGASSGHPTSPERSTMMGSPRSHPPPTPPLPGTSSFDFPPRHSPGNASPAHSISSTNPEYFSQLRSSYPPIPEPGQWHPPGAAHSPTESSHRDSVRKNSYPEPPSTDGQYPVQGLAQQRPLPASFPPVPGQAVPPTDPQMTPATPTQAPTWKRHHFFLPAISPSYPPPAYRYVCPICQKPFDRPSSLKIHTYSHTGEKPFKCKHDRCGKYFNVRSNMKRHVEAPVGIHSPKYTYRKSYFIRCWRQQHKEAQDKMIKTVWKQWNDTYRKKDPMALLQEVIEPTFIQQWERESLNESDNNDDTNRDQYLRYLNDQRTHFHSTPQAQSLISKTKNTLN